MCGIVGFSGKKNNRQLNSMLDSIGHRGRDDRGLFYGDGINLGMTRLAVIDLHTGLYPLRYKQYVLVYNGEIYNYKKLRKDLEKKGHRFHSSSDAEVILPLYHQYGDKAFSMLDGMFAICIYDSKKRKVVIARDKVGEKPLYYFVDKKVLIFASELKAIMKSIPRSLRIDKNSCAQYLSYGSVRGERTLLKGVCKLLPAHVLTFDQQYGNVSHSSYWYTPSFEGQSDCSVDALDIVLRRSVSSRMVADVPVGCFLSGGIDSSLMTHYASLNNPNIHTFSLRFPGSLHHDESGFARYAARHIGTIHHEVFCDDKAVFEIVQSIGNFIDEPISDPAFIPTMILSKEAKKYVSVVLSGEGADELFAGYSRYIRHGITETIRRHGFIRSIFTGMRKIFLPNRFKNIDASLSHRYHAQNIWNGKEIKEILSGSEFPEYLHEQPVGNPLAWMQKNDFTWYLPDQLLMKVDKATMARTLEARAPYLSADVITLASHLSHALRIRFFQPKYLLKKVAGRYFPFWFVWRPKHGFSVPLDEWFRTLLRPQVHVLQQEVTEIFGKDAGAYIGQIVSDHISGKISSTDKLWSMMVLVRWIKANNVSL